MNWPNVLLLTLAFLAIIFIWLRIVRGKRWLALLLLVAPACYLFSRWASFRGQWRETLAALGLSLGLSLTWWVLAGRKLPRPTGDEIKVWGQER